MGRQIQEYFSGKTVFLTGATGFLGKLVMEKLLRTCFDVKKIWLLVRGKRGMYAAERLKELINEPNTQNLWNKMNAGDKGLFPFDITRVNWDEYFLVYVKGITLYFLKDPLETLPRAQRKAFMFKIVHYTFVSLSVFVNLSSS